MSNEPILLREPTAREVAEANVETFRRHVNAQGHDLADYEQLWQWSASDLTGFWSTLWDYFGFGPLHGPVLVEESMPGAQWFPEEKINFAAEVLRRCPQGDRIAVIGADERGHKVTITGDELNHLVRRAAGALRNLGVGPGDVVAGYLPNIPETVIAHLATVSLGAIWTGVGQDYQPSAVEDRFAQLKPKFLVTADGYCWNGKRHERAGAIMQMRRDMPTIEHVVCVDHIGAPAPEDSIDWTEFLSLGSPVDPVEVAFSHPLWILYSSGTTGLPKGIVQSHGGITLELLKVASLHMDAKPGDVLFWWTSCSWMMWNFSVGCLLGGMAMLCYDGATGYPNVRRLWEVAAEHRVTALGLAPGFLDVCLKSDLDISDLDLSALRQMGCTGSPIAPRTHKWTMELTGVPLYSISGGTDVCTAFCGGVETKPVWAGELTCRYLGVAMEAWNEEGNPVVGEVGELVVTKPMPSMPIRLWNDTLGARYQEAYFDFFPGVWRHGDWVTVTDRGSVIVHGRSDSTLNRGGVRIGSSDIYRVVEALPEVSDSLVIGAEMPDASYWMPLFVVLAEGHELTEELKKSIRDHIRNEASPRHVPDEIHAVRALPHTRTGKRVEVPIKKILQGADPAKAVQNSALDDDTVLPMFIELGAQRRSEHSAR